MATTVQLERLDQRFKLWDRNGDGRIDRSDWDTEARRLLQQFNEAETTPRGRALVDAYGQMWEYLATGAKVGIGGSLTPEQFAKASDELILKNGDEGFSRALRPTISAIVDLCDTDGDGQVGPAEFKRWLAAVGVTDADADEAFAQIDTNGNGYLSVDELVNAVRDFHAGKINVSLLGH